MNNSDRIDNNKKLLLKALEKSLGNISIACKNCNLCRQTYYEYLHDEKFAQEVEDIKESAIDYTESKLFNLIKAQNPTAILFYLKTIGKKRGYVERQEIDNSHKLNGFNINIDEDNEED